MIIDFSNYRRSIYSVIVVNTRNGIVDCKKVNCYLESNVDCTTKEKLDYLVVVNKIIEIIKEINKEKLKSYMEVENKLKELPLKDIHIIINKLQNELKISMLTYKIRNVFTDLLYKTSNKEIFKIAIIMTGLFFNNDIIKDYVIIGQYPEFSIYIANVFAAHWKSNFYRNGCIKLIQNSRDVARLKLIRQLLKDNSVSEDSEFINVTIE